MKRFRIKVTKIVKIDTIIETEVDEERPGMTLDRTAKVNVLEMAIKGKLEHNFNKDKSRAHFEVGRPKEV